MSNTNFRNMCDYNGDQIDWCKGPAPRPPTPLGKFPYACEGQRTAKGLLGNKQCVLVQQPAKAGVSYSSIAECQQNCVTPAPRPPNPLGKFSYACEGQRTAKGLLGNKQCVLIQQPAKAGVSYSSMSECQQNCVTPAPRPPNPLGNFSYACEGVGKSNKGL